MRYPFGMLIFANLALLAAGAAYSPAADYAIIVGVNHCPSFRLPDGSVPRPLMAAESDATAVRDWLIDHAGFLAERVTLLLGDEATHDSLQSWFTRMSEVVRPDDHVFFFFAGHGTQIDDCLPFDEEDDLDECLCLSDANADSSHLVRDDELGVWLDDLPAARVTVALDCCHSGTGTKDSEPDIQARYLPIRTQKTRRKERASAWREFHSASKSFLTRDVSAFFACQSDQQAYERRFILDGRSFRSGQFSHFLLLGLDGGADHDRDGRVSRSELRDYITERLDETFNAGRSQPADRQRPRLETNQPERECIPVAKRRK